MSSIPTSFTSPSTYLFFYHSFTHSLFLSYHLNIFSMVSNSHSSSSSSYFKFVIVPHPLILFLSCSSSILKPSIVPHKLSPSFLKNNCVAHPSFHHPLSLVFDLGLSLTWFIGPTIPHSSSLLKSFYFIFLLSTSTSSLILILIFLPNEGMGEQKKKIKRILYLDYFY